MKNLLLLLPLSLSLVACDTKPTTPKTTDRNTQDLSAADMTTMPTTPTESAADRAISQDIRQRLMNDTSLSTPARNVKVITSYGVVTLRGAVTSAHEKNQIFNIAKQADGVKRVDNQLEINSQ